MEFDDKTKENKANKIGKMRTKRPISGDRMAWECQEWESFNDYKRFIFFRDLGPKRSVKRFNTAWVNAGHEHLHSCAQICSINSWIDRARQWDNYIQVRIDEARIDERANQERMMIQKHTNNSLVYQQIMAIEMARWLHKVGADEDQLDTTREPTLPLEEVRKGLNWSMDYERKSFGLPDNTVSVTRQTFEEVSEKFEKKVLSLPKEKQVELAQLLSHSPDEIVDI